MDKKELKFYDAPACEVVELQLQGHLLESSIEGVDEETGITGGNDNPGF